MIDPVVHAALVTLAIVLVQWLFSLLGINLDNGTAQGLAEVIVAYILSLFGYAVYVYATAKTVLGNGRSYKPPFT
jgi:hypothetical protein